MGDLATALSQAIDWLFTGHAEVYDIIWVSVKIVMIATLLATLLGVPVGGIAANIAAEHRRRADLGNDAAKARHHSSADG